MPKTYPAAFRQEAVALAGVVGSEAAAAQLGIDPRTVVEWARQAGKPAELQGDADEWQRLHDLAMAKATAGVASGKISGRSLFTILGIAKDKVDRARRNAEPPPEPPTAVELAMDELEAYAEAIRPGLWAECIRPLLRDDPADPRTLIDSIAAGTYVETPPPPVVFPDLDDLLARADAYLASHD